MLYSGLLLPAPHQGFNDRPCCICQTPQDACSTCSALAGTNLSNHPLPWLHLQAPQNARTTPRNHPPHLLRLPDLQQIGIACSASIVPGKFAESAAVTSKYDVAPAHTEMLWRTHMQCASALVTYQLMWCSWHFYCQASSQHVALMAWACLRPEEGQDFPGSQQNRLCWHSTTNLPLEDTSTRWSCHS